VCALEQLVSHAGCVVFLVGSKGETSFESAVLEESPHCRMHTLYPTLTLKLAAKARCVLMLWNWSFPTSRPVHAGLRLHAAPCCGIAGLRKLLHWPSYGRAEPLYHCTHQSLQVRRVPRVTFHALGVVGAKALRRAGSNFTTLTGSMAAANAKEQHCSWSMYPVTPFDTALQQMLVQTLKQS
jgi:hypothetical protein